MCNKCKSERIIGINAKCSDLFSMSYKGVSGSGYVPTNLCFGRNDLYGDYVEMNICLDCGQIQSKFPISESAVNKAMQELNKDSIDSLTKKAIDILLKLC